MMNWAKQQLANVAGTQEPIYGPSAIQSVTAQAQEVPYTELKKDDLRWSAMETTNVETQTFYLMADNGHMGMLQIVYSNVAGLRITCQVNCKVFYPDRTKAPLWVTDQLSNYGFDPQKFNFYADNCSVELSEDGSVYKIHSSTNATNVVDLTFARRAPGFMVGKNGTSYFGTDPAAPWGSMKHSFWPRCSVEGRVTSQDGDIICNGRGFFVHALQGMKPHHAAARWNFVCCQTPTYSAIMMEYTTPPSYGSTIVNVGGLAVDDKIICAGASNTAKHTEFKDDPENNWPAPTAASYSWDGTTQDGKQVHVDLSGDLGTRLDRIDIMNEVPRFIKQIVAGAAGTKPYIYQYGPELELKVRIGEEETQERGRLLAEATFIS